MPKLKRKKASATRSAGAKSSVPGLAAQTKSKDAASKAEAESGPKKEGPKQFCAGWYWWVIPAAVMIVSLTLLAIVLVDPPGAWYQENLGPLLKGE